MRQKKKAGRGVRAMALALSAGMALCTLAGCTGGGTAKADTLSAAQYPEKIGFEDYDAQHAARIARGELDKGFLEDIAEFCAQSACTVLRDRGEGNGLFSPVSLAVALSMAAGTADGETRGQVLSALGVDSMDTLEKEMHKLFQALYYDNEIGTLRLANSFWLSPEMAFRQDTLDSLAQNFYASSFTLGEDAQERIGSWISEQTGGKLGQDYRLSDQRTVFLLLSTIYFSDEWIDRFSEDRTAEDNFYLRNGTTVRCDYLNTIRGSHGFRVGEGFIASSLSFKNGASMVFVLPDEGGAPEDFLTDPARLRDALTGGTESGYGEVVFQIPKFDYGVSMDLEDALEALGMTDLFDGEKADFSPLSDAGPLFISSARQDACIAIDEKGCEAAAYTELAYAGAGMPEGRAEMILNRPFLFAIMQNGLPLFVGVVENPAE